MNTEILLNRFKKLLAMEEKAEAGYEHYIKQISEEHIKKALIQIRDDEKRHVDIAKKMVTYF